MRIGALEAGGTKMVMAIGNENGQIMDRYVLPTNTPEITIPKMVEYFKANSIYKLGIGSFGPVCLDKDSDKYGHILETPKTPWKYYDILGAFERALQIPCYIDTDVNVAALGEATWGSAQNVQNVVYITVGTGIGAGILVNGKPVHGMMHPEAGHILVRRAADDSFEGNCPYHHDCLEGMASGPAIEKRWQMAAYELGNRKEVWELEAYYLAQAIVNYIMILSPQKIILGGGVMHQKQLMDMIRNEVLGMLNGYIQAPQIQDINNYIVEPALSDNQGIMGCIRLTQI